jgi:uncharacterized DUF497 family protein
MAKEIKAAIQAGKHNVEINLVSFVLVTTKLLIKGSHGDHVEEGMHHIKHMNELDYIMSHFLICHELCSNVSSKKHTAMDHRPEWSHAGKSGSD